MGPKRRIPGIPDGASTVGSLLRTPRLRVKAVCLKCGVDQKVNLYAIAQLRGYEFSLINATGRCRLYACDGPAIFMCSIAADLPFLPLRTGD